MTPFPTYAPIGYQPNQPEPPQPSQQQMEAAIRRNAQFIHNDGRAIYIWRFEHFYYADWLETSMEYGAWSEVQGDYPAGELIEL